MTDAMAKEEKKSTVREGRGRSSVGGPEGPRVPSGVGGPETPGPAVRRVPSAQIPPRRTLYLGLLFLSCVPFRGMLDNWLFNDDFSWLRAARHDMTWGNLFGFQVVEFFRPLVNLSFYLTEKAAPGGVSLQYACNLALHFLCTLLVFHVILNVLNHARIAAAAAALFALTSVHSGAVLWISARTTLLATCFLLASLAILTSRAGTAALRIAGSIALYILALASKEEAIAGMFLVGLLFMLGRKEKGTVSAAALGAFAAASILYLLARHAFMGGIVRENWGPGAHAMRNVAGGTLFQLYPWPLMSLAYPRGTYLPEPAGNLMPEILAVPLLALLIWGGYATRRSYAVNLAVGWMLLSLLPASFFRYRFFSTVSISQDRYYYLSSVGAMLLIVLFLSMLWNRRSRLRRAAAACAFIILCAGYLLRDTRLERKWDDFTRMYREVVEAIKEESGAFSGTTTLAVEDAPLAFPYLGDAIALEMPGWKAVEVTGGRSAAERFAPCLYVSYTGEKPKLMRMERVNPAPADEKGIEQGPTSRERAKAGAS